MENKEVGRLSKWDFDYLFNHLVVEVPVVGKSLSKYYHSHNWFQRLVKFTCYTTILFWLVKGPLIGILALTLPNLNLLVVVVPSYILAAFLAGIIISLISFVLSEIWVWKKG